MKYHVLNTSSDSDGSVESYDSDLPQEGCQKCLSDKIANEEPLLQHDSVTISSSQDGAKPTLIKIRILLKENPDGKLLLPYECCKSRN